MKFRPFEDFLRQRLRAHQPRRKNRRGITTGQVEILERRLQLSATSVIVEQIHDADFEDSNDYDDHKDVHDDYPTPNPDDSGDTQFLTCHCPICQATYQEPFGDDEDDNTPTSIVDDPDESGEAYGGELFTGSYLPTSETFKLHSNVGAKHTIYLDFDGHTTSNTIWNTFYNGGANFTTAAFDLDGNTSSFSTAELQRIQAIWARVAEDFMPFDVNVTTEDPGAAALTKSGAGDDRWGVRVVIGGSNSDWYGSSAGGVAFVGSFNWDTDTPTYVFENNLGNGNEKYTAEAISHEAGHTLGLNHDGRSSPSEGYYQGTSTWAPIMGVGYYTNLSQWSKGEYANANNTQDDLAVITGSNGFGYRTDDYGDTIGTASTLIDAGTTVNKTGIISQRTDYDVFSFTTTGGTVNLNVNANARGPNLDILAELYDSGGNLVTSSNPTNSLNATISVSLAAGTYYLKIDGVGYGDPVGTGYSDYGSLGFYTITGTLPASDPSDFTVTATDAVKAEGDSGTTNYTFTVTRTGGTGTAATVDYAVTGVGGNAASASDFASGVFPSGTVSFAAGESSKTITVTVVGDINVEADETFRVTLSNASGTSTISVSTADGTIQNDDVLLPSITVTPLSGLVTNESGTTAQFSVALAMQPTDDVTIVLISLNPQEGTINKTTLTFTSANWNVAQTVTVTGVDDALVDGSVTYLIKLNQAVSNDADYNGMTPGDVEVTNEDNESTSGKGRKANQPKSNGPKNGGSPSFVFDDGDDTGEIPYFFSDIEGSDVFFHGAPSSTEKLLEDAYQAIIGAFEQSQQQYSNVAGDWHSLFDQHERPWSPLLDSLFADGHHQQSSAIEENGAGLEAVDSAFASVGSTWWN